MERRRIRPRSPEPPAEWLPAPTASGPMPPAPARVHVSWGALNRDADVQGMTIQEAYSTLREPMRLAPRVTALVNGTEVDEDYVLEPTDRLEFIRASGEKGRR